MKASRAQVERAWGTPELRLLLLHGPDEAGSRAFAQALGTKLGDAERTDLSGAELKNDPARLADEAASLSLFGGKRYLRVEAGGDEILPAVEALLATPVIENPVVIVTGALRRESKLLKLALASPHIQTLASYPPEGGDAGRLAATMARELGLRVRPDVAHRLAAASGNDRAVLARELEKFALYLDAAPEHPAELDGAALDALQADASEGDLAQLVDAILLGRGSEADAERTRLAGTGIDGVPVVRALLRRLLQLAQLRAEVEAGNSTDSVIEAAGKALFWKDKPAIAAQLQRWSAADLRSAIARALSIERSLKASGAAPIIADQELVVLTHASARLR